jgi:hypothetical protein
VLAAVVVVSLFAREAGAAPMVVVTSSYNQAGGYIEWEVAIAKNDPAYTGAMAIELPIVLSAVSPGFSVALQPGSDLVNAGPNQTWYYNETSGGSGILLWNTSDPPNPGDHMQTIGFNPFTMSISEGLVVNTIAGNIFAALGSAQNLPNPVPTLHIASADAKLTWTNAIVGENGVQYEGISGMATSVMLGDMNGNGSANVADDLSAFSLALNSPADYAAAFPGLDRLARGDVNQDGAFDLLDLGAFVPEPATSALLLLGIAALSGGWRRRG